MTLVFVETVIATLSTSGQEEISQWVSSSFYNSMEKCFRFYENDGEAQRQILAIHLV